MKPIRSIAAMLATTTLAAGALLTAPLAAAQSIPINGHLMQKMVFVFTNQYRESKGVTYLQENPALMQAAQLYAEYQARTNTSGHTADGRSPGDRIAATGGYKACGWAENVYEYWSQPNVATVPTVAAAAMAFWKQSPGHEANLRHTGMKHIGIGAAAWNHNGRMYYKIVQVFGNDCGQSSPVPMPPLTRDRLPSRPGSPAADAIRHLLPKCKPGFVWREAAASDRICVTQESHARVVEENRTAAWRVQPGGGAYGPNTCRQGFVWREAFNGDGVCVPPPVRDLVHAENRLHASRVQQ